MYIYFFYNLPMKKKLLIISFLLSSFFVFSQDDSRWRLGGGLGFGFGNSNYTSISIQPFVSYQFSKIIDGGLSAGYQYAKWDNSKQNLFNFGPFINIHPIENVFMRVHFEQYFGNQKVKIGMGQSATYNYNESALWLGAGYRTSGKVSFFTGLMYNVLYKEDDSLFSNGFRPIVGVSVGL